MLSRRAFLMVVLLMHWWLPYCVERHGASTLASGQLGTSLPRILWLTSICNYLLLRQKGPASSAGSGLDGLLAQCPDLMAPFRF